MTQDSTQHFIETIDADRDQRIAEIQAQADAEISQILGEVHERSRQLQQDTNRRLRSELSNRRQKETSRIHGHLRRQLWRHLAQLQEDLSKQVQDKLEQSWKQPAWQLAWCELWLQAAAAERQTGRLRVDIDKQVEPDTLEKIRAWAEANKLELEINPVLRESGLVIYWQDFELDGRLSGQFQTIREAVLARLAPVMPELQQIDTQ